MSCEQNLKTLPTFLAIALLNNEDNNFHDLTPLHKALKEDFSLKEIAKLSTKCKEKTVVTLHETLFIVLQIHLLKLAC